MNNADKDKADKLFKMIQPSFKIDVISKLDARDPGQDMANEQIEYVVVKQVNEDQVDIVQKGGEAGFRGSTNSFYQGEKKRRYN